MKVIIHDLGMEYNKMLQQKCDVAIYADGKYAPCQGCFGCWTKHPAECYMKDSLHHTFVATFYYIPFLNHVLLLSY